MNLSQAKSNNKQRLLVANRGEIALRVIRSARAMGIETVAVYSEADRNSLHVQLADFAVCLGPAPSSESYLCVDKILQAAADTGSTLIHPGYGFLSENAAFARSCVDKGITFVGPSPESIEQMGDKVQARLAAKRNDLPLIEGSHALDSIDEAKDLIETLTFPILLKAKAGGGGKGMRLVESKDDFESAFNMAQSEASKAFSDGTLYIERFLQHPRHIEVQVFGKSNGETLIFGFRDCSIQRRHQKIIEEAGELNLKQSVQKTLHDYAHKLCQDLNYQGAGTLEFLLDQYDNVFFLEMNTRLQVEHPVTEWIYGVDLVHMQILNALKQDDELSVPQAQGHSIELRIYAEDPLNQFLPSPGKIHALQWPQGHGIRVDCAIEAGHDITPFYDPMIAKLSVHAQSRPLAIAKILSALYETKISGIAHNLHFLQSIVQDNDFAKLNIHTQFLDTQRMQDYTQNMKQFTGDTQSLSLIALLDQHRLGQSKTTRSNSNSSHSNNTLWWQQQFA